MLTREQEADLTRKAQAGDRRAEAELVVAFNVLVQRVAARWRRDTLDRADLEQEARIGLLKAIRKHDPARGRLATIAALDMANACRALALSMGAPITLPRSSRTWRAMRDRIAIRAQVDLLLQDGVSMVVAERRVAAAWGLLPGDVALARLDLGAEDGGRDLDGEPDGSCAVDALVCPDGSPEDQLIARETAWEAAWRKFSTGDVGGYGVGSESALQEPGDPAHGGDIAGRPGARSVSMHSAKM